MPSTRTISFAGSSIALEYVGEIPTRIIDTLYRHVSIEPIHPAQLTYRLIAGEATPTLRLYRQETLLYQGDSAGTAAELLLGDSCYHLAARSQNGLLFHAAGLSWRGQGLILPGVSGSGKTTLTAWLLTKGFDYLTDELVFVPRQTHSLRCYGRSPTEPHRARSGDRSQLEPLNKTHCLQTFPRPLNLKWPARTVLQDHLDWTGYEEHILSTGYADLVPPQFLTQTDPAGQANLRLILFPRYQPEAPFELRPLSKAQAGLALMQNLINARNLPQHGFSEVVRLAGAVSAYQLTYANFEQVEAHLDHFIGLLTT